jgi:uncharacterized phage protein (TIGR01671 family)
MTNRRTIKFRIWHKKYKRWLTANDYETHSSSNWMMDVFTGKIVDFVDADNQYSPTFEPNYYVGEHCVIDESPFGIQQYTGLKDANGVEIYEGDILKHDIGLGPIYYKVFWSDTDGAWMIDKNNGGNCGCWFDNYEIAGNIFENAELLKQ